MITEQKPLQSGFGPNTTAQEVIAGFDLGGKVAVVTGGHGGIGLETTRALAGAGATVIVGARDVDQARETLASFGNVEVIQLDLAVPESIDAFAEVFLSSERELDILILNAGVSYHPTIRDERGYDTHFATNYLGHFQLTTRLWEPLKRAENARVVALSSTGHLAGPIDFDDLHFAQRPYDKAISYGASKTACSLFAIALDKRGQEHGVRAFAVHPGAILSGLARHLSDEDLAGWGVKRNEDGSYTSSGGFKTTEQGAATSVWCAVSPMLNGKGGVYCEDVDIAELLPADSTVYGGVRSWAIDPALAEKLWTISEDMLRIPHGTVSRNHD
ncbi:SDR family NAD(P)-dependent oxidoreductase [Paenibacillus sacheonensis]|uniref:SDR family NAD(P)-dependent oxidoreductase n=1 Tax=Paenibacillus sacheonensis TaxID=742054 RepID=A0A7X5C2P5_9BACL|nr:SDR family NAD(P)-dependent oxidoreductase [Paenibacillus sacheonensis]MBM7566410.1 NAD(P)-dependent dehydrogenase (short-subunit alcohol dehydrogenase family) [Paenibacillus sacheonensis]NBC70609.1 SDR family NAD(P)-dependent oxidoreductase [Paenibacillus sacheonensis]